MSNFGRCDTHVSYFSDSLSHERRPIRWNWNTFVMRQLNPKQDRDQKERGWKLRSTLSAFSLLRLNLCLCLSLSLQTRAACPGAPPAPSPSVWLMRSDLSDSRNPSADFIRSLFPANPSMCLFGALGDFSVAYGNVLPPIIVHLVPWYHPPPSHSPLICIQMTFLSGRLHHNPVMNEPPSFT